MEDLVSYGVSPKYEEKLKDAQNSVTTMERKDTVGPVPLVLFSGGLDSTMLLCSMLMRTQVDVLYIYGPQGSPKEREEDKARAAILKWMEENRPYRVRSIIEFRLPEGTQQRGDQYPQVLPWLYGAMTFANGRQHSEVAIGYVMGDDINQHLRDLQEGWDLIARVSKQEPVRLTFPLNYTSKQTLLREIQPELYKLIWFCELPKYGAPCGQCEACLTHAAELHTHMLRGYPHPNGEPKMKLKSTAEFKALDTLHEVIVKGLAEHPSDGEVESGWDTDIYGTKLSFMSPTRRVEVQYAVDEADNHVFRLSRMEAHPSFDVMSFSYAPADLADGLIHIGAIVVERLGTAAVIPELKTPTESYEIMENALRYFSKKGNGISVWQDFEFPSGDEAETMTWRSDLNSFAKTVGEELMLVYIRKALRQAGPDETSSDILHRILGNTIMKN